jgi:hypothetical protein
MHSHEFKALFFSQIHFPLFQYKNFAQNDHFYLSSMDVQIDLTFEVMTTTLLGSGDLVVLFLNNLVQ